MNWQEPITALVVAWAVVSLYRHLRNLVGPPKPDAPKTGCHGCGGEEQTSSAPLPRR